MTRGKKLSLLNACRGFRWFFKNEIHAFVHLLATIVVIVMSLLLPVSRGQIATLVIVTGIVWIAEIFNTCIERIMDFISMERHPVIREIKDMSAAAVLVASIASLIVGIIIFLPMILALFLNQL